MDMAFLQRAGRMLGEREPAPLDHKLLLAALALRAPRPAPRRPACGEGCRVQAADEDPLVELLLAGPAWRQAQSAQRGCFSRAEAGRRVNGS